MDISYIIKLSTELTVNSRLVQKRLYVLESGIVGYTLSYFQDEVNSWRKSWILFG